MLTLCEINVLLTCDGFSCDSLALCKGKVVTFHKLPIEMTHCCLDERHIRVRMDLFKFEFFYDFKT